MSKALTEEQIAFFHEEGYLIFKSFFDEDEIAAYKTDMDQVMADRAAGTAQKFQCEYPNLGPLISHPRMMEIVEAVMGPGFAFHHLHTHRQDAGTKGVHWHQDYEQEPQTNRSHVMVHVFYYFNGLNGEVGDLMLVPKSQKTVIANGALWMMGTEDLPGAVVVDDLPPGSAVLVHSALWHARRAKPGGENRPRYFADSSYCQAGVKWPSYGINQWRDILRRAMERGLDRDGKYAHLFDENHFFDRKQGHEAWRGHEGSLALQLRNWEG